MFENYICVDYSAKHSVIFLNHKLVSDFYSRILTVRR